MAQYIILINWTDQRIRSVKESPKRLDTARAVAKKLDMELKDFLPDNGRLRHGRPPQCTERGICCEVRPWTRYTRKRAD